MDTYGPIPLKSNTIRQDGQNATLTEAVRSKEKQILEDKRNLETQVADQVAEQLKSERRCQWR